MRSARWGLIAALGLCGCTLGFDTGAVPFEARGAPGGDAGRDLAEEVAPDQREGDAEDDAEPIDIAEDLPEDMGIDPPKVIEGLGLRCGVDENQLCYPDAESWPGCAAAACERALGEGAVCLRNSQSLHGYCSRRCEGAEDCVGDPRDVFAASMRCVSDPDGARYCKPGSQSECAATSQCAPGESCKQVFDVTQTIAGWRCQTDTPLGAAPGGFCNEDPRRGLGGYVQRCADDSCVDDVCLAWCEPGEGDEVCQSGDLRCRDLGELGEGDPGRGRCAERPCSAPADCEGDGVFCAPQYEDEGAAAGQPGHCRADNPRSRGNLALGAVCGTLREPEPEMCASRYCVGYPPYFYCSALCDGHEDCGSGMLCVVASLGEAPERFTKVCAYAPGSQEVCSEGGGCAEEGEVCAPYLFGDVSEDGLGVRGASAEGRCVERTPDAVQEGNTCGGESCEVPGGPASGARRPVRGCAVTVGIATPYRYVFRC